MLLLETVCRLVKSAVEGEGIQDIFKWINATENLVLKNQVLKQTAVQEYFSK